MVEAHIRLGLNQLLSAYGDVESIECLPDQTRATFLILATMRYPRQASMAQHALGLTLFGFSSLLINEHWLRERFPSA